MSISLKTLLPPALLENPVQAAAILPRALITRANFIPGVRHRLGWRGVRDCAKGRDGLTVRVTGMAGVYGLELCNASENNGTGRAIFNISYFPTPDEELTEAFSIQAGLTAHTEDYLERVREFTLHDDLRALFRIASLEAFFVSNCHGAALALTAPESDIIIAINGVMVETATETVQAVTPGGKDQDLPAWDTALPFFHALAASASYCLKAKPQSLTRHLRPGTQRTYSETDGLNFEPTPDLHYIRLGLGWDTSAPENTDFTEPDLLWSDSSAIPKEYTDAPWMTSDIQGASNSLDKRTMGITDKPRLIVLTGFLGSGKTTFLTRFIEDQAAKNGFVAVIQNEIGQKGLDGKLLGQSYAVTEVDEGCVCCTLAGSLRSALSGILSEFQPDFVVLETTGLANPANLLSEIADLEDMLDFASVTTVLDASGAPQALEKYEVARSQVRLADVLLINKTDLTTEAQLIELEMRVQELNPTGARHQAIYGDIPSTTLYGVNLRKTMAHPTPHLPLMGMAATHQDDDIQSTLISFDAPLDRAAFHQGISALPAQILRAKGVVQFQDTNTPEIFQYVPGSHALTPADSDPGDCFMVIIGQDALNAANNFRTAIGICSPHTPSSL